MLQLVKAFPEYLRKDVEEVLRVIPPSDKIRSGNGEEFIIPVLVHDRTFTVVYKDERLIIPTRVYFNEPDLTSENGLTDIQQTILNCIYLRHHDGFVRQRRLEKLVCKTDEFVIPFTLQLLGEYIFEILEVLNKHINEETIAGYKAYIDENPRYWQQTKSRMVSYWDAYYRHMFPNLIKYLGNEMVMKLDTPKQNHPNDTTRI